MSGTLNKVMLIGHLGDEVKMHYFEGGNCIGRFPLATNESYTNRQSGEKVTQTEWHNIVMRNKGAEICEKYLKKGDKIYIEGRLKTRQWTGDDGQNRYSTEVHASDFTFLTPKEQSGVSSAVPNASIQQSNAHSSSTSNESMVVEDQEDDLPF